ncbi:MAG: dipeptide ABC transporter ATP-binding protein DppD [Candidatus Liberibacter europaeus]|uniref:Dipeptide ABC transporter ATP-binding protein DppD n=1 Tax=Candidatus Liberibacter europaeus TaxID=744859 RepID=A0A2T4VWE6_9HYPH|nr:dipeptide ABC transporter ATP-binding protein DppD [Candidatus Liberibacter europaeus]PTL86099.1 MAG: dipeptide ABC transporter ATP-binding protein DppD [Candidatus Liberibacter europaeus]
MVLLDVKNLSVNFRSPKSRFCFRAVDCISYEIKKGEVVGVIGESGSGKSVNALAIMGLIDYPGYVVADNITFDGHNLLNITDKDRRRFVSSKISIVFQDPMNSLNPCFTIGCQIIETLKIHQNEKSHVYYKQAIDLLTMVEISDPISCLKRYPHQLSGGMNQRVMIAMALACKPQLLIVDEPTTALDVTIQDQIMKLLLRLQKKENMALMLITHDLALVAQASDSIIVMYSGQIVEYAKASNIFTTPRHPYTQALLKSLPEAFAINKQRLFSLPGVVPGKYDRVSGCLLSPRCPYVSAKCQKEGPLLRFFDDRKVKCHTPLDDHGSPII